MATSLVHFLSQLNPKIQIGWISKGVCSRFLTDALPHVRVFNYEDTDQGLLDYMSEAKVQLIVDLQGTLRSRIYTSHLATQFKAKCIHIKKDSLRRAQKVLNSRFTSKRAMREERSAPRAKPQYKIMIDCLIKGLQHFYGMDNIEIQRIQAVPKIDMPQPKENKTVLHVAPGASFPTKQAPQSLFVSILNQYKTLCLNSGLSPASLVFLGDQKDGLVSRDIISNLDWPSSIEDTSGQLDLYTCARHLRQGRVLLCNDSGLAHIAEAVETDTAVLFGPTHEEFGFYPHRSTSRSFSVPLNCRPCSKHGNSSCRFGDLQCFHLIDIDCVARFLLERIHS